jgi:hypothetical protein
MIFGRTPLSAGHLRREQRRQSFPLGIGKRMSLHSCLAYNIWRTSPKLNGIYCGPRKR